MLDTGLDYDHPEFLGRALSGHDFVNDDSDPTADHPHGVLVTGLLAANANNAFQVTGIDHHCTILPVKVLDENNKGNTYDLVQALYYCVEQNVDLINLSLINYSDLPDLKAALQTARDAGIIMLACGGNQGLGDLEGLMALLRAGAEDLGGSGRRHRRPR